MMKQQSLLEPQKKDYLLWTTILLNVLLLSSPFIALHLINAQKFTVLLLAKITANIFINLIFLLAFLALVHKKPWLSYIFLLPLIVAIPFEFIYLHLYKMLSTVSIISVVFETDPRETSEMLSGFKGYLFITLSSVIAIWMATLIQLIRSSLKFRKNIFYYGGCGIIICTLVVLAQLLSSPKHSAAGLDPMQQEETIRPVKWLSFRIYPIKIYYDIRGYLTEKKKINSFQKNTKLFTFNASDQSHVEKQIHVIVIGESARAKNWGALGYERDTTPYMSKEKNAVIFTNTSAPGTSTRDSVPLILTRATAENFDLSFKEKSFIKAFREVGYQTFWLSNHNRMGLYNETMTTALTLDAEVTFFTNTAPSVRRSTSYLDGELLPKLSKALSSPGNKKLIVLHFLGSHFQYADRHPPEFAFFQPALTPKDSSLTIRPSLKQKLINSYDNSIRYTDFLLAEVIRLLENENSVSTMTYISDHGENLYDEIKVSDKKTVEYIFHSIGTKYEIHVPYLIWTSQEYDNLFPDKKFNMKLHKTKKTSIDNVFYTLLDLANIDYTGKIEQWSLVSPQYKEKDRYFRDPSRKLVAVSTLEDQY